MASTLYENKNSFELAFITASFDKYYELIEEQGRLAVDTELVEVVSSAYSLAGEIWDESAISEYEEGGVKGWSLSDRWIKDGYMNYDGAFQVGAGVAERNNE